MEIEARHGHRDDDDELFYFLSLLLFVLMFFLPFLSMLIVSVLVDITVASLVGVIVVMLAVDVLVVVFVVVVLGFHWATRNKEHPSRKHPVNALYCCEIKLITRVINTDRLK